MKKYSWKWFGEMLGIGKKEEVLPSKSAHVYVEVSVKPYKSAKLIGRTAIFVLQSGVTLEKLECTESEWNDLLNCKTEQEMAKLIYFATEKKPDDKLKVDENWEILKDNPDFDVDNGVVKLKGVNRSLPVLLVNKFVEIVDNHTNEELKTLDEFIALKNFWYWLCLNPFPEVVDNLYDFLHKGDFKITRDGMFLGYRRVCKVAENTDLVDFISNSYVKIKGWKKSPKNYSVYSSDDFEGGSLIENSKIPTEEFQSRNHRVVGNLADLYQNLDTMEENRYTDNHTRSFDIRIGKVVSIPRSECTHSNMDCGTGGLHFANKGFNYYSFGDTGILMLINPMNVVGTGDNKGRTSEYLPLCVISEEEERSILGEKDFDTYSLQEYYAEEQLKDLEENVKLNYITEAEKDVFSIKPPTKEEVKVIIHNLQEIVKRKVNDIKG